jgi:hypothetical protein
MKGQFAEGILILLSSPADGFLSARPEKNPVTLENDFDLYCQSYLRQWEQRATVRGKSRTRLSAEAAQREIFPAEMQPILKHPEVVARGPDARRRVLAYTTSNFMEHVAILEVEVITDLCVKLVNQGMGAPLPESARQVALTVSTDEAYHAYVAREFLGDLERHTGIAPDPETEGRLSILTALNAVRRQASPELMRTAETMVLCFAENFVTEELFGLSKETTPGDPFHVILREHMMDEGRHQIFFQNLLGHLWSGLDEEKRTALGQLVPPYLDSFLTASSFVESQAASLRYIGFDAEAADRIAREAIETQFGTELPRKSTLSFMRNALHLVKVSSMLDHPPTRQTLIESGWVDA